MKKILIVEDIHSIRTAIKDVLAIEYSAFDAKNYSEAVEILKSEKIDLLITDIKMPGKSATRRQWRQAHQRASATMLLQS
jgi:DNA-binding response OmpR family regulator